MICFRTNDVRFRDRGADPGFFLTTIRFCTTRVIQSYTDKSPRKMVTNSCKIKLEGQDNTFC